MTEKDKRLHSEIINTLDQDPDADSRIVHMICFFCVCVSVLLIFFQNLWVFAFSMLFYRKGPQGADARNDVQNIWCTRNFPKPQDYLPLLLFYRKDKLRHILEIMTLYKIYSVQEIFQKLRLFAFSILFYRKN